MIIILIRKRCLRSPGGISRHNIHVHTPQYPQFNFPPPPPPPPPLPPPVE